MTEQQPVPRVINLACGVVAVQGIALVAVAVVLVLKTLFGHPSSVGGALSGAALAVLGGAALGAAARGLSRLHPSARTPVVVIELLALPVSYSLAFQAHRVAYGAPILISALAVLYLLFTPPAREALDREPPH